MPETIDFRVPNQVPLGEVVGIEARVNSEFKSGLEEDVTFTATFSTSSGEIDTVTETSPETQAVNISTSWSPSGAPRETTVSASVELQYNDESSSTLTDSRIVQLVERVGEDTIVADEGTGNSAASSLSEFYQDRTDFFIDDIVYDPDTPSTITGRDNASTIVFEYKNPNITVDSSARFVKHDIIGSKTLRQKVGKDPLEISVEGVCYRDTARRIDGLRYAETGTIRADRFDGSSVDVQFASSTTEPLEDGSAVDFTEVNELFSFSLELTETE